MDGGGRTRTRARVKQRTDEAGEKRVTSITRMGITNGERKTNGANGEKQLLELAERHATNRVGYKHAT